MDFRFTTYKKDELEECGQQFLKVVWRIAKPLEQAGATTRHWTDFILDNFASTAAERTTMVFGTHDGSQCHSFMGFLSRLRVQSGDGAPWLCIDLPWSELSKENWSPSAWLLSSKKKMERIHEA